MQPGTRSGRSLAPTHRSSSAICFPELDEVAQLAPVTSDGVACPTRMRALAESIRVLEPGAAATLGADRGRIPAATAGTDGLLPELFGMNVWFAPHEEQHAAEREGIAGCTVRKWSGEAAVQARYGMIDLVEAAGAILGP